MLAKIIFLCACTPLLAQSYEFEIKVNVLSSEPVYENILQKTPYEHCWDEKVPVRVHRKYNHNVGGALVGGLIGRKIGKGKGKDAAIIGSTLIGSGAKEEREVLGGILGGVLARKVGKGKGNDAAIAMGTLLGANLSRRKTEDSETYKIEKRCETKYKNLHVRQLVGYSNSGKIMGKTVSKFSNNQLKSFSAKINVSY